MQIEEGFRDVKSPLFGLGFGVHQSRQDRRIEILLLIAMLANMAMMVAGLGVRTSGQQKRTRATVSTIEMFYPCGALGWNGFADNLPALCLDLAGHRCRQASVKKPAIRHYAAHSAKFVGIRQV